MFLFNVLSLQVRKEAQKVELAGLRSYGVDVYYPLQPNNLHALPLVWGISQFSSHLEKKLGLELIWQTGIELCAQPGVRRWSQKASLAQRPSTLRGRQWVTIGNWSGTAGGEGWLGRVLVSKGAGDKPEILLTLGPDRPGFESWHTYVFKG